MRELLQITREAFLRRSRGLAVLVLLGASACSGSVLGAGGGCPSDVALDISGGTQPTFRWAPDCEIVELTVYHEGNVVWGIHDFDGSFSSPVRYGIPPRGREGADRS